MKFTVPLCAIHHSENHATGDERGWWEQHKIDPLVIAEKLWRESRLIAPSTAPTPVTGEGETASPQSDEGARNE